MIHFLYLVGFAFFVSVIFGVMATGTLQKRILYGVRSFVQFVGISLVMAWAFYFIPW